MEFKKQVVCSFIEFLQAQKSDGVNSDNIDLIVSTLEEEFDLTQQAEVFQNCSYFPAGLSDIFEAGTSALKLPTYAESLSVAQNDPKFEAFVDVVKNKGYFDGAEEGSVEYLKRNAKLVKKFIEKKAKAAPNKEEQEKLAEDLKFRGNAAINAKDYEEAIRLYTEALSLTSDGPNSHVYHSNRAAAYCHMNKYQEAVDDCEACLSMCPDYVKAYSRLGLANFFLERFEDAVSAYEKAVELEPDNKASQDSLRQARNKLRKVSSNKVTTTPSSWGGDVPSSSGAGGSTPPAIPASMLKNPAVKQAMDQMGGPAGEFVACSLCILVL